MCNKHSLAYWLDDIRPEAAFLDGNLITEINIKFLLGAADLRVKRQHKRGEPQIAFISVPNVRTGLRLIWVEANSGSSGVIWRHDRYTARL